MDELISRQMPHSVEAEQAVLGSVLIDERCIPQVMEALKPEDFYLRQNREIFETVCSMFNFSETIDPVTVLDKMKQLGVYDENTSYDYIRQLMVITPTAANVGEYINIVKDKSLLRRVAETAGAVTALIQEGTATAQEALGGPGTGAYLLHPAGGLRPLERAGRQRPGGAGTVHRPSQSGLCHCRTQ